MWRKILFVSFILLGFMSVNILALDQKTNIYFFHSQGCTTCAKEELYLQTLEASDPNIVIHRYEIAFDKENQALVTQLHEILNININSTPSLVIGRKVIVGFTTGVTDKNIESSLEAFRKNNVRDVVGILLGYVPAGSGYDINPDNPIINLPIFGEVNAKTISLPLLAIVLGTLDGFNPCAMWVLLLLISMLFHLEERWKKWLLGGIFLLTTAVMYLFFMISWLNIAILFGTIVFIRWAIAGISLVGGGFNIRKYLTTKPGCEVMDDSKRHKISDRVKQIFNQPVFILAIAGVIVLAISVNLVELICSAGLPVLFTQVLSLQGLSPIEYFMYIMLYLFFFMVDDIIVFVIAMKTAQLTGLSTKYARNAHLIGGIVMVVLGILMIFRPEWLMLKF